MVGLRASRPFPALWRLFRRRDEAAGTVMSFIVAAAVFMLSSTFLVQFLVNPPGSVANLETISLREKGFQALDVLLGSPGQPAQWSSDAIAADAVQRLGVLDPGSTLRIDPQKFDRLAKGSYASPSRTNGYVDYEEAKRALALTGYEFHIRAHPLFDAFDPKTYGIEGMSDYRVGYVGHWDGVTESTQSKLERGALTALSPHIRYNNATRITPLGAGDAYKDDGNSLRSILVPALGTHPSQTVIRGNNGNGNANFQVVEPSAYKQHFQTLLQPTLTRALVLADDAGTLKYTQNREIRAILGYANMTGLVTAELSWSEWVDANDDGDYGWVEVSTNGGATWIPLTNTESLRSQDHAGAPQVPADSWRSRSVLISSLNCPACLNVPELLVALHWTADNDATVGHGWIVDNVQIAPTTTSAFSKTFERPDVDVLVIGSNVDQNAFTPAEVKYAIRDYVNEYGGRIIVMGGQQNTNWLQPIFHVGIRSASPGVSTPDTTHPLLVTPNELSWESYNYGNKEWDFSGGDSAQLFNPVVASGGGGHILSVSRQGAFSANGQEGVVMLTTYLPWTMETQESRRFLANALMYGRFHHLFLDYGPSIPDDVPVSAVSRTAIMDKTRGEGESYVEMNIIMYVWAGGPTTDLATSSAVADKPWNVTSKAGVGRVDLTWTAPTYNGSAQITEYLVYRGTQPLSATHHMTVSNASYQAAAITGNFAVSDTAVVNGVTYYYNITAVNAYGQSASSVEVSATPSGLAGAPQAFAATGDAGLVTLSWTEPLSDGGSIISGYRIYRNATGSSTLADYTTIGTTLSWQDTSVQPGVAYRYAVAALNAMGAGTQTATLQASPLSTPAAPVVTATGYYRNIVLSWAAPPNPNPADPITGYRIYAGASASSLALLHETPLLTYTHAPLGDTQTWYYRVSAVNGAGEGPLSAIASATTVVLPGQPTAVGVTTTGLSPGQLRVTWLPPTDTGGGTVRGYNIFAADASGAQTLVHEITGTPTIGATGAFEWVESGLGANRTRFYKVSAITQAGEGPQSAEASGKTFAVPHPPVGVSALPAVTPGAPGRLVVTWSAPLDDGGSPIMGYQVYYKRTSAATYTLYPGTFAGPSTTLSLSALTSYHVYVVAINAVGTSNASNVLMGTAS